MAVLLQLKNATKSYGNQVLLDDAELTLVDDVKVGFVGRNGAGKSTLLRVLLGEEELERGEVIRTPNCDSAICGSTIRFIRAKRSSTS